MDNRDMSEVSEKLKEIMVELLPQWIPIDEGWTSESMDSLNFNSYQYIQLIVKIEEKFDMKMDDEMLSSQYFETIQDLCNCIVNKINCD